MEAWIVVYSPDQGFRSIEGINGYGTAMYVHFYWSNISNTFVWNTNLSPKSAVFKTHALRSIWLYKRYLEQLKTFFAERQLRNKYSKVAQRLTALGDFVKTIEKR